MLLPLGSNTQKAQESKGLAKEAVVNHLAHAKGINTEMKMKMEVKVKAQAGRLTS